MPNDRDQQDERGDTYDSQQAVVGKVDYKIHYFKSAFG